MSAAYALAKRQAPSFIANEIATRMAEKLALISLPVTSINLQQLPGDEKSIAVLRAAFARASGLPVLLSENRVSQWFRRITQSSDTPDRNKGITNNIVRNLSYTAGVWPDSADLLWSNLVATAWPDPLDLAPLWHAGVKADGYVMFTSLGPDTAQEVIAILRDEGTAANTRNLVDMHDWGDALVQAGFSDPVMDMEKITLTYREPAQALRELAALLPTRPLRAGLISRAQHQKRIALLEKQRNAQGLITITLEVIYGHAFKVRREEKSAGTTVDALRATLPSQRQSF